MATSRGVSGNSVGDGRRSPDVARGGLRRLWARVEVLMHTRPGFDSAVVAIMIQDNCGWSSTPGETCVGATFFCPHTVHSLDCWTCEPAAMREEAQRCVQELAQQKAGCACGLEPTDLDIGILGPF